MTRQISFALTTPQFKARTKTVTRRLGWAALNIGDELVAVEKSQGLKKGEKVVRLGRIRVTDICRERLDKMTWLPRYGEEECIREGFPNLTPELFVAMFCGSHKGCTPASTVTRIAFEYIDSPATDTSGGAE